MNTKHKRIQLIIIVPTALLWLISNLYYFWVKVGGSVFIVTGLVELVCFLTSLIAVGVLTSRIMARNDWRTRKNYLTISFFAVLLVALWIPKLNANENTFQSPVKIRACYEGTMNTSNLYFRENGSFEDFNIGFMGYVHYCKGTWTKHGDTLQLVFDGEKPIHLNHNIIIKGDYLYKVQSDTLSPTFYYLGYCKGLN